MGQGSIHPIGHGDAQENAVIRKNISEHLKAITCAIKADRSIVILMDGSNQIKITCGEWPTEITSPRGRFRREVIDPAIKKGTTLFIPKLSEDTRYKTYQNATPSLLGSFVAIPLAYQNAIVGALYISRPISSGPFNQSELSIVTLVAEKIADMATPYLYKNCKTDELDAKRIEASKNERCGEIIGRSSVMQDIYQLIEKVAPTDMPVLIQGETGTGKELIANAVHQKSLRADEPHIAFNCGTLPESLLESGLFGHVKGAFTNATEDRKGYIELASTGTLFIDEITDMSAAMQQRILRVLEEKSIWPVGAQRPVRVNTRFIFASKQNIENLVKKESFREDLFYRIKSITINLPPLRERKEDISLLVKHFIGKYLIDGKLIQVDPEALKIITDYHWPGNVRELENEIKKILILYPKINMIKVSNISSNIHEAALAIAKIPTGTSIARGRRSHEEIKSETIMTLKETNWNVSETARRLHRSRTQIYNRMKEYNIESYQ